MTPMKIAVGADILAERRAAADRFRARLFRRRDDLLTDKIALAHRARPDVYRLVGHANVQRAGVGVRIDRDRPDQLLERRDSEVKERVGHALAFGAWRSSPPSSRRSR